MALWTKHSNLDRIGFDIQVRGVIGFASEEYSKHLDGAPLNSHPEGANSKPLKKSGEPKSYRQYYPTHEYRLHRTISSKDTPPAMFNTVMNVQKIPCFQYKLSEVPLRTFHFPPAFSDERRFVRKCKRKDRLIQQ